MASPEQIYFVLKSGISVYPENKEGLWYICVNNNGVLKRFEKTIKQDDINDSIAKTIIYYYNLLKK